MENELFNEVLSENIWINSYEGKPLIELYILINKLFPFVNCPVLIAHVHYSKLK